MLDDQALITKAQQGDRTSLNILTTKYWQPIYRFVYHKVSDVDDAQEIAQETFLKALRALPRYQAMNASFKTYLLRIAQNLITDLWRKRGRSPQLIDIADYQEPLVDDSAAPETATLKAELQHDIKRLIAQLPEEQQRAIQLRLITGLSVSDTAQIMGKTDAAIKMLQQRALKNLRKLFIDNDILQS